MARYACQSSLDFGPSLRPPLGSSNRRCRLDTNNVIRYIHASIGSPTGRSPYEAAVGIVSFGNKGTEDLFEGDSTRDARRVCPQRIWRVALRKLDQLNAVTELNQLRLPPGNELEPLRGDRKGQHSIRINDQYRICFRWTDSGPADVEIVDYH